MSHRETREQPVYALVTVKGGPKFHESAATNSRIRMYRGTITGKAIGIGPLAVNLSYALERPVIDKSGLAGKYDFELKWAPEAVPPPDADDPSLFTALSEQRLGVTKGPSGGIPHRRSREADGELARSAARREDSPSRGKESGLADKLRRRPGIGHEQAP